MAISPCFSVNFVLQTAGQGMFCFGVDMAISPCFALPPQSPCGMALQLSRLLPYLRSSEYILFKCHVPMFS